MFHRSCICETELDNNKFYYYHFMYIKVYACYGTLVEGQRMSWGIQYLSSTRSFGWLNSGNLPWQYIPVLTSPCSQINFLKIEMLHLFTRRWELKFKLSECYLCQWIILVSYRAIFFLSILADIILKIIYIYSQIIFCLTFKFYKSDMHFLFS